MASHAVLYVMEKVWGGDVMIINGLKYDEVGVYRDEADARG